MKGFYRFGRAVVYPVFRWLHCLKIEGRENIPDSGAYILASNHTSISDPFFLGTIFKKQIFFMGKIELFKVPVLGKVLKWCGAFAVDRGKGDMNAISKAEDLIKDGNILGIFPEGTRYKEGAPRKAKSGIAYIAMDTNADILPVSIYRDGAYSLFKKTTVRIGKLLKYDDLVSDDKTDRANMKCIVEAVTKAQTELWEMKH